MNGAGVCEGPALTNPGAKWTSQGVARADFTRGVDLPMMITAERGATGLITVIEPCDLPETGTFTPDTGEEVPR